MLKGFRAQQRKRNGVNMSLGSTLSIERRARRPAPSTRPDFTDTQRLTLQMLCDGFVLKEIAAARGVTVWSVHEVLESAQHRAGAKTRYQLLAWFAFNNWRRKKEHEVA